MCESEVVCLNGNCKFNDVSMDGNCAKGEEPQLYDCREAIIARRGVHGLLVSAAQDTKVDLQNGTQQLKQAIALVRRYAGLHLSIGDWDITENCLDLIEQRACV